MRHYSFRWIWEPRDLWIGVYREPATRRTFICPLPCLVLVVSRAALSPDERDTKGGE